MKPTNNFTLRSVPRSINNVAAAFRRPHSAARPYAHPVIPTGEPRLLRLVAEGSFFGLNAPSNSSIEPHP
jgi:hypothetical protein